MLSGVISERIRSIAKQVAEKGGFEFVKLEIGGTKRSPVIRIFIDKPDGLTVEHCADVSREIDELLESEDMIPTKYVLEVSSPGLERELTKLADFERFAGKLAKIKTSGDGSKTIIGVIGGVKGEDVLIETRSDGQVSIPFDSITKANLKVDLDAEFRKR